MDDPILRGDCERCSGLCCVTLFFEQGPHFGFDKAAGVACRHLSADDRCCVHEDLAERGMSGCVRYDCLGAGQAVTAMVGAQSWRDGPEAMDETLHAFRFVRNCHELVQLLGAAARLDLTAEQELQRGQLAAVLYPASGWTRSTIARLDERGVPAQAGAFLRTLAPVAAGLRG